MPNVRPYRIRADDDASAWRRLASVLLSAPATANAPGSLMLFQVVSIQPSERWICEMRNSSMWPLKGSAMPLTCRPMPRHSAVMAPASSRRVKFGSASSRLSRQPLSPAPIEALKHGVDLLLAVGSLEMLQGLEPDRFDGGGALKPPGPPLGHQLCRTLEVHSAALADQGSQERVCLGRGRLIRLEAHELVGQLLEQAISATFAT